MSNRHFRRNASVQLMVGLFGQTGYRLFQAPTYLPAYLFSLSGSDLVVGLARTIEALGHILTPMLAASIIGHRTRILGITMLTSLAVRLQILFIALVGLIYGASQSSTWLILLFMAALGIFQGMSIIMMNSLKAKVIPVKRRGFVSGWQQFLSGIATALLAYFAGSYFIDQNILGNGYAALFLLAFLVALVGIGALGFTKEPSATSVRKKENYEQSFKALPNLLRNNRTFANFLVVAAIAATGRMAAPFYILYAGLMIDLTGSALGALTTIWLLSGTITNVISGSIADRHGYRLVLIGSLALWALAHCLLLFIDSFWGFTAFFFLFGTASNTFNQARQNIVMEFGDTQDIPLRLATSHMTFNTIAALGPLVGGVIAFMFDYSVIFIICTFMQMLATVLMIKLIPEPRQTSNDLTVAVTKEQ